MNYYVVSKIQDGKLKYGVISKKGKLIVPFAFDSLLIEHNCFVCCKEKKWGVLNDKQKVLIDFEYDSITSSKTFFEVRQNNLIGLFSLDGQSIVKVDYEEIKISENDIFITKNQQSKVGVYTEGGIIIPNEYDEIKTSKLGFLARIEDSWGLINHQNSVLIEFKYQSLSDSDEKDIFVASENNKYGYLGLNGNWVIHPFFDEAQMFDINDRAIVGVGYFSGLIDRKGRWIIKADSQSVKLVNNIYVIKKFTSLNKNEYFDSNGKKLDLDPDTFNIHFDKNGFQSFTVDYKKGLKDETGNIVISANYEYIISIDEHHFICYSNGKMGIINSKEDWLLEPKFEIPFWQTVKNKGVKVKFEDSYYFFDLKTHTNIKFRDDFDLGSFDDDGYAITKANSNKYGLLFCNGEWQIPPLYDKLSERDNNNLIKASINGKYGWIDINGNWVIEPVYDKLYRNYSSNIDVDRYDENDIDDDILENILYRISETFDSDSEHVYFENEITDEQKKFFKSHGFNELKYLLFINDNFEKSKTISGILLCEENGNYFIILVEGCSNPVKIQLGFTKYAQNLININYSPSTNILVVQFDKSFQLDCSNRFVIEKDIVLKYNQYMFFFYNSEVIEKFCEMIYDIINELFVQE